MRADHFIGGERRDGAVRTLHVLDPANGEPVTEVAVGGEEEVRAAVSAATGAARDWRRTPAGERAAALRRVAQRVRDHAEELAQLTMREMGRPIEEARGGVAAAVGGIEQYAELGPLHRGRSLHGGADTTDLMVPEPRGVVAVVTPWNDPVAVAAGLLAAALVTGNTAVHKPSERTPATGTLLTELFAAELPPGVCNLVSGDGATGGLLVQDDRLDLIVHVGSTATGRSIAAAAAATDAKVLRENGGKDALVVDEGVDPVWAAEQARIGAFVNAGQLCTSIERIYVHRGIADAFVEALVEQARALRVGPGSEPGTTMGPLVDRRHRESVHAHVTDALERGAKALLGGEVPEGPGAFYPPTVLVDCDETMPVMAEETFGPVAAVRVVDTFDEGLDAAADSAYGLAAIVLTPSQANAQRAWHELPVGTVKVNAVFGGAPGGAAEPRRASGMGVGYGPELLDEMTALKVVHVSPAVLPASQG